MKSTSNGHLEGTSAGMGVPEDDAISEPTGRNDKRTLAWRRLEHVHVNWKGSLTTRINNNDLSLNLEAVKENLEKLEKALVGKLIGRRVPFAVLLNELKKKCAFIGDFHLIMFGDDCFTCIFKSMKARDAILLGGPWNVAWYIMGLDKWSPTFSPDSLDGLFAPVWIWFPKLPLLY